MASCPGCNQEFDAQTIGDVAVAVCKKCRGLWLNAGDLDRVSGRELEAEFDSWMSEPTECRYCQTPLGFGADCVRCGKSPTLQCPKGHGVMNATLVEIADREFEIDQCPSCRGVWIDGHEREHLSAVDGPTRQRHAVAVVPRTSDASLLSNAFLAAMGNELTRTGGTGGLWFAPDPGSWGKGEPLALIFFFVLIAAAIALLYQFSGGALVVF